MTNRLSINCWFCLFLWCSLFLNAPTQAATSPFASGADVVLLSGMAGDVESETESEEIANNLLSWLAELQPAPTSVTLFSDLNLKIPPNLTVEKFEARKSALIDFVSKKASSSHPLLFLAWGHGGLQQNRPVFHVKGPRIEPGDLATVLKAWPGKDSCWILSFRTSGGFAAPLAALNAKVLSSEGNIIYNSDPLLMKQTARVLRESPGLSFEELAKQAAEETIALYAEKKAAATEDPMFWSGPEKPKMLVASTKPTSEDSPLEPKIEPEPEPEQPTPPKNEEVRPASASGESWKLIQPVDAAKFPDEDAVILSRSVKYVVGDNPVLQTEWDQFVQILTHEGQIYADISLSYNPPEETLEILNCELRTPEGKIIRISPKGADQPEISEPGYNAPLKKSFSIPGAVAGSILRMNYRRSWKRFPLPYVFIDAELGLATPALKTEIEVRTGKSTAFHYMLQGLPAQEPEIESTSAGKRYRWQFENLPGQVAEVLSPPESTARLQISTFPDWEAFAGWYERLIRLADKPNAEIAAKAKELTKNAKTDLEKVEALYNYVTALRYVMIPLGVNSHRPHSAESTFRNQFGDCKDKANLFNTMLGTLGIEAYLVLVPRFSQADEKLPGLAFNHAISQVRLKDQTLWIDTTDPTCRFGMLPPGDPGRKVLVIDGKSRGLELLPYPDTKLHSLKLNAQIRLDNPKELSKLRIEPKGFSDYLLRMAAAEWTTKSAYPILWNILQPVNGQFSMTRQKLGPIADLSKDTWWEATGQWSGLLGALDNSGKRQLLRAPVMLPEEWEFVGNKRTSGIELNKGYPLRLEQTFQFSLPKGAKITELPSSQGELPGIFQWSCDWKETEGGVTFVFVADLSRGDFGLEAAGQLAAEIANLRAALATGASLEF